MPGYDRWREDMSGLLVDSVAEDARLSAALRVVGDDFTSKFASNPDLKNFANSMVEGIKSYRTVRDSVYESIKRSSLFTFEYAYNKMSIPETALAAIPTGTTIPDLSTGRLIFSSPIGTVGEATLNGSATFFNSTNPLMHGNLRD